MTLNLTAREQELLIAVIDVMKADIDWKAVAPKANFTTPKQARDKWAAVRTKITASANGDGAGTPAKKKATPKKRKNSDDETPSKSKKTKKDSPQAEEDDDEEATGLIKPEKDDESEGGGFV